MSKLMFVIMMVAIFVFASVVSYFAYSKIILKGKKPTFNKVEAKEENAPDEE